MPYFQVSSLFSVTVAKFHLVSLKSTRPCLCTITPSVSIFCVYVMPLNPQSNFIFKYILTPLKTHLSPSPPREEKISLIFIGDLSNEMARDVNIDEK